MKFSWAISQVKWLNDEKANVLKTISLLVIRVLTWIELGPNQPTKKLSKGRVLCRALCIDPCRLNHSCVQDTLLEMGNGSLCTMMGDVLRCMGCDVLAEDLNMLALVDLLLMIPTSNCPLVGWVPGRWTQNWDLAEGLGPTQFPTQWVPGALSLGVKRLGHEADHSPPSSAEVKEWVELYLHSPNMPSWRDAHLKHRDNFTLTFYLYDTWRGITSAEGFHDQV
jgi:hypothetical protein